MSHPSEDIKHIRNMMERSSRFMAFNGLALVAAGMIALVGAAIAYFWLLQQGALKYDEHFRALSGYAGWPLRSQFALLATGVLVCATLAAYYFLLRKSKKNGLKLWSPSAKQAFVSFCIPLAAGGVFCIALILNNNIHFMASAMLIFYGLGLVNAGKFTLREVHILGLCETALGLCAAFFLSHGLLFWVLGFGVLNILAGGYVYIQYDQQGKTARPS